jgi:hypothetical protein
MSLFVCVMTLIHWYYITVSMVICSKVGPAAVAAQKIQDVDCDTRASDFFRPIRHLAFGREKLHVE